jgi:hypothetical protein
VISGSCPNECRRGNWGGQQRNNRVGTKTVSPAQADLPADPGAGAVVDPANVKAVADRLAPPELLTRRGHFRPAHWS